MGHFLCHDKNFILSGAWHKGICFFGEVFTAECSYKGIVIVLPHFIDFDLILDINFGAESNDSFLGKFICFGISVDLNTIVCVDLLPIFESVSLFGFVIAHECRRGILEVFSFKKLYNSVNSLFYFI